MQPSRVKAAMVLVAAIAMMALQLASATTASAATTCRHYDGFRTDTGTIVRNVTICAAPATDYPSYSGWGRLVDRYTIDRNVCGFSLFPFDIDDPMPAIGCAEVMPTPVEAWRWTASGWQRVAHPALIPGKAAYFAPFAPGWRWAWTSATGWVAIPERHAAYRWRA